MQEPSATNRTRLEWIVWGALILTVLVIAGAFIYNRSEPIALPVIGPVGEFTLTNQHGKVVSDSDLRGHVWIANIIFTRCAGPCPLMTKAMKNFQEAVDACVRLVTLTTDPDNDTPEVLKRYGEKAGADFARWSFLTGAKGQIARLAVDGLKLVAQEKPISERTSEADLFIHSTLFVVVDRAGNLRAAFELEDPDLKAKLLQAVNSILKSQD